MKSEKYIEGFIRECFDRGLHVKEASALVESLNQMEKQAASLGSAPARALLGELFKRTGKGVGNLLFSGNGSIGKSIAKTHAGVGNLGETLAKGMARVVGGKGAADSLKVGPIRKYLYGTAPIAGLGALGYGAYAANARYNKGDVTQASGIDTNRAEAGQRAYGAYSDTKNQYDAAVAEQKELEKRLNNSGNVNGLPPLTEAEYARYNDLTNNVVPSLGQRTSQAQSDWNSAQAQSGTYLTGRQARTQQYLTENQEMLNAGARAKTDAQGGLVDRGISGIGRVLGIAPSSDQLQQAQQAATNNRNTLSETIGSNARNYQKPNFNRPQQPIANPNLQNTQPAAPVSGEAYNPNGFYQPQPKVYQPQPYQPQAYR